MAQQFTEAQVAEFKTVFMLYVEKSEETISINKLGSALRALGNIITEAELSKIVEELDGRDLNGKIDFPTFLDVLSRDMKHFKDEGNPNQFKALLDINGTGFISVDDLRFLLTVIGEPLSKEEVDEFLKSVNINADGQIKCDEILDLLYC